MLLFILYCRSGQNTFVEENEEFNIELIISTPTIKTVF